MYRVHFSPRKDVDYPLMKFLVTDRFSPARYIKTNIDTSVKPKLQHLSSRMRMDTSSVTDSTVNDDFSLSVTTTAQPPDMHHLVAAAVSTSASSECHISNSLSLDTAQVNMHVSVHSENRTSFRPIKNFGSGVGASNLILDGPSLNNGCSESDNQKDLEVRYEARLSSLAKIPASRLGKGNATMPDGNGSPSVFPPAFTVVLGGIPPNLAHRLFTSTNSSRIFSQSAASLPVTPSAAAIIAAPPNPDCTGSLFFTSSDLADENNAHSVGNTRPSVVRAVTPNPHLVTVVAGETGLSEVDESSAAVAELTSEEATVSVGQSEPFEEDIDESIQISTS
ncbi:hypothetical protein EGR_00136 [Echinococcus granulosus]|uniref:Uncharacterized protein n=2 Tax=Echinococcus granulosus TaxID=6210 RepID=W6V1P1_ECHGR|nr:hypothetical protein EGR_00136 [Echinococcus granulosus]EUB64867.1 hypothetical protein EGR_00136 [Echinococcus granulosus]